MIAVAHDIDDACGLHYRKPLVGIEANKNISRKERDARSLAEPHSSIVVPPCRGAERIGFVCRQLSLDKLFVTRSGVDRKPRLLRRVRKIRTRFDPRPTSRLDPKQGGKPAQHTSMSRTFRHPPRNILPGKNGFQTEDIKGLSLIHAPQSTAYLSRFLASPVLASFAVSLRCELTPLLTLIGLPRCP